MSKKKTKEEFGNPKIYKSNDINPLSKISFGELYEKTIKKESELIDMGYNVISIWESDFEKNNN